jgi:hypothetical protein
MDMASVSNDVEMDGLVTSLLRLIESSRWTAVLLGTH